MPEKYFLEALAYGNSSIMTLMPPQVSGMYQMAGMQDCVEDPLPTLEKKE